VTVTGSHPVVKRDVGDSLSATIQIRVTVPTYQSLSPSGAAGVST
jgi:hypothetical protein